MFSLSDCACSRPLASRRTALQRRALDAELRQRRVPGRYRSLQELLRLLLKGKLRADDVDAAPEPGETHGEQARVLRHHPLVPGDAEVHLREFRSRRGAFGAARAQRLQVEREARVDGVDERHRVSARRVRDLEAEVGVAEEAGDHELGLGLPVRVALGAQLGVEQDRQHRGLVRVEAVR